MNSKWCSICWQYISICAHASDWPHQSWKHKEAVYSLPQQRNRIKFITKIDLPISLLSAVKVRTLGTTLSLRKMISVTKPTSMSAMSWTVFSLPMTSDYDRAMRKVRPKHPILSFRDAPPNSEYDLPHCRWPVKVTQSPAISIHDMDWWLSVKDLNKNLWATCNENSGHFFPTGIELLGLIESSWLW